MAPNPIMIPRKPVYRRSSAMQLRPQTNGLGLSTWLVLSIFAALALSKWSRDWLLSGAAIESLLLLYGSEKGGRVLVDVPLWTLLATLNLAYAICSTSWLLNGLFTILCYLLVSFTTLTQFPSASHLVRRVLRKILGQYSHFVRDKLALFNLPALEIDTTVDGLFVIRGVTISLRSLTITAHGIEVGLKLADDIELALFADEVTVRLFRRVEIGDVYANLKGGKFEMTFASLEDTADDVASEDNVFLDDTPLLRAATAGSKSLQDRPTLRETLTGVSYMRDSSAKDGLDMVKSLSPDDEAADRKYHERLTEIRTTSAVYQSRQQVRHQMKARGVAPFNDEKDIRAAIAAELHEVPSIAHPPQRSVRVTTLQNLSPPWQRRFMHRLPFLLRLLLAPLSYFHPVDVSSINFASSGKWVSALLQQKIFKNYIESNSELRRLHRRMSHWLADANFCCQLTDIQGLAQVPLSTYFDIVTYLKFTDVIAYRTQSGTINQVVRLGGADATFTIPSYLLPHHEHIVPPKVTPEDEEEYHIAISEADGTPNTVQAEADLKQAQEDEANVTMSVHASLPASCDQSLLNFIAALVKATKIIELEKEVDEVDKPVDSEPATPVNPDFDSDSTSIRSGTSSKSGLTLKEVAGFKVFAKNIRQNLKDSTTSTGTSIKEFAKDLHQSTKDGMKKAVVGSLVNDRWVAKIIGKTAALLQTARGDVGYSGTIPVPLAPYRGEPGLPSKLLP